VQSRIFLRHFDGRERCARTSSCRLASSSILVLSGRFSCLSCSIGRKQDRREPLLSSRAVCEGRPSRASPSRRRRLGSLARLAVSHALAALAHTLPHHLHTMLAHTLRPARFVPAVSHFSSSARRLHRLLRASADKLISLSLSVSGYSFARRFVTPRSVARRRRPSRTTSATCASRSRSTQTRSCSAALRRWERRRCGG